MLLDFALQGDIQAVCIYICNSYCMLQVYLGDLKIKKYVAGQEKDNRYSITLDLHKGLRGFEDERIMDNILKNCVYFFNSL